jgi:hypothetical protein
MSPKVVRRVPPRPLLRQLLDCCGHPVTEITFGRVSELPEGRAVY